MFVARCFNYKNILLHPFTSTFLVSTSHINCIWFCIRSHFFADAPSHSKFQLNIDHFVIKKIIIYCYLINSLKFHFLITHHLFIFLSRTCIESLVYYSENKSNNSRNLVIKNNSNSYDPYLGLLLLFTLYVVHNCCYWYS